MMNANLQQVPDSTIAVDNSSPLVSIIIPTRNRAWCLTTAISSVIAQSYSNIEIVVVDNCSTDGTPEVVRAFSDDRIIYFRQASNVGPSGNWETGLRLAHGEYLSFLGDDDQFRPAFVVNRIRRLCADPNLAVVFSRYDTQDCTGRLVAQHNADLDKELCLTPQELLQSALGRRLSMGAAMYRTSLVRALWNSISSDDVVLDFALHVRMATTGAGHGLYIPTNDSIILSHPDQISQAQLDRVLQKTSTALERVLHEGVAPQFHEPIRRELARWHVFWGCHLYTNGRVAEARTHFARAIITEPQVWGAWMQLALSLLPRSLVYKRIAISR